MINPPIHHIPDQGIETDTLLTAEIEIDQRTMAIEVATGTQTTIGIGFRHMRVIETEDLRMEAIEIEIDTLVTETTGIDHQATMIETTTTDTQPTVETGIDLMETTETETTIDIQVMEAARTDTPVPADLAVMIMTVGQTRVLILVLGTTARSRTKMEPTDAQGDPTHRTKAANITLRLT